MNNAFFVLYLVANPLCCRCLWSV